jgi:lipid-A-disaccharide synthase
MRYYLICGERSGDLHSSNLIKAIKERDTEASFRGVGGDYSVAQGLSLFRHYKGIAFMGIWEVFRNLFKIGRIFKETKQDILEYQPDALILVDFGGFNLRMAAFAKANRIPVHYYISPKVWAWNVKRAYKLKERVDHLYCILSFEVAFFKKFGMEVHYVGNPLADAVAQFNPNPDFTRKHSLTDTPIIAILPGSRVQELKHMLGVMLQLVDRFPNYRFVVAGVSNLEAELYQSCRDKGLLVLNDETYDLLWHAHAAVVTSGTATLETCLLNVPQVVVYKTSALTYFIGKWFVKVPFISLVNLIAEKKVVTELIQDTFTIHSTEHELNAIASEGQSRQTMLTEYVEVKQRVGDPGVSGRVADLLVTFARNKKA